jgi:hypothetical protein
VLGSPETNSTCRLMDGMEASVPSESDNCWDCFSFKGGPVFGLGRLWGTANNEGVI